MNVKRYLRSTLAPLGCYGRFLVASLLLLAPGMAVGQSPADSNRVKAVKVATDTIRFRLRNTTSCRTSTCLAGVRSLATRIDSLESATLKPPIIVPPPTPPPPPPPPPVPVVLPTPSTIAPGSGTAPGPQVSLTPLFQWSGVNGATGYIVAIRDVGSNVIVYPSATGVGTPIGGTSGPNSLTLPAGVLVSGTQYRWDVTAVAASTKSLASANRYFTTVPVSPPPPATFTVSLTASPRDTISGPAQTGGTHWTTITATVRNAAGVVQPLTLTNLVFTTSGDTSAVTRKRNNASDFEVHTPTRSGSVTITARWPATGATASKTIVMVGPSAPPPPPPIDTTTPPPPPPPSSGGPAELPRVVPAFRDPYPGRSCSLTVVAGGDVRAALTAARGGSVVCLTAGATYGATQLPARAAGDTGYIVLRTATSFPAEGVRIRPSTAGSFAKILTSLNGEPAFTTTPGTHSWFVRGIEITTAPAVSLTYTLVLLGTSGPDQDTMSEVPQRLIFSQMYIHGSTNGEMQRCIGLQSGSTAIVDSWFSDCHGKGYDSQAIGGWNGPGPHLVRNNYLEGVGENVMWGGATPSIPGLTASDITFQRNHVYTPIAWKGRWTKKNLLELKNAVRVLIEDSVFDGSWTDGQSGVALLFKSINDMGSCNWCRTMDVTVRRSYVTNSGGGIVFSGAENYNSFGTVDSVARRFLIQDVVFDRLNIAPFVGGGRGIQVTGGARDVTFDRTVLSGNLENTMLLDVDRPAGPRTAFRNSVWTHGGYFATASGPGVGLPSMTAGLPGFVWQSMTVVRGATLDPLPAGTTVVTAESQAALAAQIRATVNTAIAGVVVPP